MNEDFNTITEKYVNEIKKYSNSKDCLFQLIVNSQEYKIKYIKRDSDTLKKDCISMRNLKGEWI